MGHVSCRHGRVVICFHFSNFEPLETAGFLPIIHSNALWFAFILVTLSHWKQLFIVDNLDCEVVICFHFSNFEPLETASCFFFPTNSSLWFAFILVTLSHWKQQVIDDVREDSVVICFHFSNFEPLETAGLWFAGLLICCDLLSF